MTERTTHALTPRVWTRATWAGWLSGVPLILVLDRPAQWLWACATGVMLPFLVTDIMRALAAALPYSLHACVAAGGLLAGAWQTVLLRPWFRATGLWMVASASG
jgi:hypothetical protein